ncbi:S-adenosyl-L-methionine-dependent methyltransferase [Aspergillus multicolor]|uniref:S-adenosyl-L-methionine-dependent methyltransferase n=1 Tax=Aspergillus multicolor TaxID=41759 RepID=UPI003CCD44AD
MGLFDAAVKATSGSPSFTVDQIADQTKADPLLILRIMRVLVGMRIFTEVGIKTYKMTPIAKAYVSSSPFKDIAIHLASHAPSPAQLPNYFLQHGYTSPTDTRNGPFQYAMRTEKQYFDWVASQPRLQEALNTVMAVNPGNVGQNWFEYYPVTERLRVKSSEDVILVDVGGNTGKDLASFREKFPPSVLPGRAILQDQPFIIEKASCNHDQSLIETMGHDFFTPQPVKGAKAYYLRLVIHDWPDRDALLILRQIRDAMDDDSVLLLNESLVAEEGVSLYDAWMDMTMLALFSALNRTEAHFTALLEEAGFQLVKVWRPSVVVPGSTSLFEAVKR